MHLNLPRRSFIKTATTGLAGLLHPSLGGLFAAEAGPLAADLFDSPDPAVLKLTSEVFQHCILGKVKAPKGVLKQRWIAPGGGYNGQWIWDTMFVVDLLSILPDKQEVIREVFRNFWDFQVRWNKEMPDFAHDMVPCMINPDDLLFPAKSSALNTWA